MGKNPVKICIKKNRLKSSKIIDFTWNVAVHFTQNYSSQ